MPTAYVSFINKLAAINWFIVIVMTAIACLGFAMMVSAGNGAFHP